MAGLTNYTRYKMLGPLTGTAFAALANDTYLSLLTALPSGDGTSSGGDLTSLGAAEWTPARKVINVEGGSTPRWVRQSGDNGGWEMALDGEVEWGTADTAALGGDISIVGFAVYDAITGGNMLAYKSTDNEVPRVVATGGVVTITTDALTIGMFSDTTA